MVLHRVLHGRWLRNRLLGSWPAGERGRESRACRSPEKTQRPVAGTPGSNWRFTRPRPGRSQGLLPLLWQTAEQRLEGRPQAVSPISKFGQEISLAPSQTTDSFRIPNCITRAVPSVRGTVFRSHPLDSPPRPKIEHSITCTVCRRLIHSQNDSSGPVNSG